MTDEEIMKSIDKVVSKISAPKKKAKKKYKKIITDYLEKVEDDGDRSFIKF
jgi:hypothetical protein